MSSAETDRLARFRAAKRARQETEERKERAWDLATLGPLRRAFRTEDVGRSVTTTAENQPQEEEDEDEEDEPEPWNSLDWAILAVKVLLWVATFYLCVSLELGLAFVLTSGFAAIWLNLGTKKRKAGVPSAYSVFNPECKAIDGTLTAEQFEREIRHGPVGGTS